MKSMKLFLLFVVCVSIFTSSLFSQTSNNKRFIRHETSVPGQYLVALANRNPSAIEGQARSIAASYGGTLLDVYQTAFGGFLVELTEAAAERLSEDPRVRWVEEDAVGTTKSTVSAVRSTTITPPSGPKYLWHLDRLDELYPANGGTQLDGTYSSCTGKDVVAYVMDTGIWKDHQEFSGRAIYGVNFSLGGAFDSCSASDFSHGTAVASLLGGNQNVVANGVNLVSLRTNACNGVSWASRQIAALNWIVNKSGYEQPEDFRNLPLNPYVGSNAVLNWSGFFAEGIGGYERVGHPDDPPSYVSDSVEVAVADVVNSGVVVVTSADNYATDACGFAPNHLSFTYNTSQAGLNTNDGYTHSSVVVAPSVISVGGTSWINGQDHRWQEMPGVSNFEGAGSNSGRCIDLWAPAADIVIPSNKSTNEFYVNSGGTSWSAAIVSGMVARRLEFYGPPNAFTARNVFNDLKNYSTLLDAGGGPLVKDTSTPDGHAPDNVIGMVHLPPPTSCGRTRPASIQ